MIKLRTSTHLKKSTKRKINCFISSPSLLASDTPDVLEIARKIKAAGGLNPINVQLSNNDNDILNKTNNKSEYLLKHL